MVDFQRAFGGINNQRQQLTLNIYNESGFYMNAPSHNQVQKCGKDPKTQNAKQKPVYRP